ncbi:hypothetical protein H2201_003904 [Coniosporium apollinis]|uniref:Dopey N-terminal domain-containing protein n=1 Tax=Coniosporium apollinis TaxID=61459 RepID=A0ABQ9NZF7_9PEZI|nr:hypothetical protein H2201_003904 [Coniosporium apollinis]
MSLEPSLTQRALSPASSGRSSPVYRNPRRLIEDGLYKKDKNLRKYASNIERALSLFDTAQQEWADYISFLARLLKAIQTHPPDVRVLPHATNVATRLAQCLNPSLPSGVHQKALEVYTCIFAIIGREVLARDISIFFPGLSTVLSFASLSVRPAFLALIEAHVITLDPEALRPALKAIIICLLPGLEEETSEEFEHVLLIFDKLKVAVNTEQPHLNDRSEAGDSFFWQCFFLATISNTTRRQGALAYLVRNLPRLAVQQARRGSVADEVPEALNTLSAAAEAVISPEPGLLVRCFASGLADQQLLVQRGFLDLLATHVPLDSPILQERTSEEDLDLLVAAATGVVLRRDMSLNRRLWSWLLGPGPGSSSNSGKDDEVTSSQDPKSPDVDPEEVRAAFFSRHGLQPLHRSIMKMIRRKSSNPAEQAKPFRICLSLMDHWEVGALLVPGLFLPLLDNLRLQVQVSDQARMDEVLRSASNFFDGVESSLIWGKMSELVFGAFDKRTPPQQMAEKLTLVKFVITHFNVRDEEMVVHHMPLLMLGLLAALNEASDSGSPDLIDNHRLITVIVEILDVLFSYVPARAFSESSVRQHSPLPDGKASSMPYQSIRQGVEAFYDANHGNVNTAKPPFNPKELGRLLFLQTVALFRGKLLAPGSEAVLEPCTRLLVGLNQKVYGRESAISIDLVDVFHKVLNATQPLDPKQALPFPYIVAVVTVITTLQVGSSPDSNNGVQSLYGLVPALVSSLWSYLSPFRPKYHIEAARCLWQLHTVTSADRVVEASITKLMVSEASRCADSDRCFATLWTHTIHEQSMQTERGNRTPSRRPSSLLGVTDFPASAGASQALLTRPLLLLLDNLAEEGTERFAFVKMWLEELPSLDRVFDILISPLRTSRFFTLDSPAADVPAEQTTRNVEDIEDCLCSLRHILNILRSSTDYTWTTLAEATGQRPLGTYADGLTSNGQPLGEVSLQQLLLQLCLRALSKGGNTVDDGGRACLTTLHRTAVSVISRILVNPYASSLRALEAEVPLLSYLKHCETMLQPLVLGAVLAALKLRVDSNHTGTLPVPQRKASRIVLPPISTNSPRIEQAARRSEDPSSVLPPPMLVEVVRAGLSSTSRRIVLRHWVDFLAQVLPLFADAIFQNLLPLVDTLCKQIRLTFEELRLAFKNLQTTDHSAPEPAMITLMDGLEQILASAHDRLRVAEVKTANTKSPEQPQGFFGNMVSGVFSAEAPQTRSATANSRLTVILCFQDTVRICFSIWSWAAYGTESQQDPASLASFGYTSSRMRNRARRTLEHLFTAEPLECLETLAVIWSNAPSSSAQSSAVLSLLNVLSGTRPKITVPTIFNSIYSRTNPIALDRDRMSTLTSDLADLDLVAFLIDYTRSLEDDAMDEIWPDCSTFLRDVLANPLPHRQILPALLGFTAVLAEKVDNTNFGEQRRMRRELGDLFTRLLTAAFTTKPMGFLQDPSQMRRQDQKTDTISEPSASRRARSSDIVTILASVVPKLQLILVEADRITTAAATISANVIGPTFRSKSYPENVSKNTLELLYRLSVSAHASKVWRKDISDAFNDARFFATPLTLAKGSWLPLLQQWVQSEKDRLPELLDRLSPPTTAGIMFGVGASSARLEADRRTQLNLRRIAVLILAAAEDAFLANMGGMQEKLVELLTATPASSPSSATRAEVFMVLRALVLKTSSIHLASLWPIINAELQLALTSVIPSDENYEKYDNASTLQACKLLDTLITIDPDDFQLHEWLFITDTIDAVYKPADWSPVALADEVAEALGATEAEVFPPSTPATAHFAQHGSHGDGMRRPMLDGLLSGLRDGNVEAADVVSMTKAELAARVLRPFFGQLSIGAFEATYGMEKADWRACFDGLLRDLFDEGGVVG